MRPSWTVIPSLALAGFVSSVFTVFFIWSSTVVALKSDLLYTLLGSASFALSVTAVLWFRRELQTGAAAIAVVVTVAAHLGELYARLALLRGLAASSNGAINPVVFRQCLIVGVPVIAAFLLVSSRRRLPWIVLIAPVCAVLAALLTAYIDETQRGAWISFLIGYPLWPTWQVNLAFFLGVALWLQGVFGEKPLAGVQRSQADFPSGARLAVLGILAAFFGAVGIWHHIAVKNYATRIRKIENDVQAGIAESIREAPSAANLPHIEVKPIYEVLLMNGVGDWKPYLSGSSAQPEKAGSGGSWVPCPCQVMTYYARYAQPGNNWAVVAHVTEYPDSDWAKYEVRNTPMPNEAIEHPNSVATITRYGNELYQQGPYFYWSSGNRLILLECEMILPPTIDEFLKAYLEKYPSSL